MRSSRSYFPPDPSPGAKFREFPKASEEEGHSCQSHCSAVTAKCVDVAAAGDQEQSGVGFRGDLMRPRNQDPDTGHLGGFLDKCT